MAKISTCTGSHFTIRMTETELRESGIDVNELNPDAFMNTLYHTVPVIHEFLEQYGESGVCLVAADAKVNEPDIIFALFPANEELLENGIEAVFTFVSNTKGVPITVQEEMEFLIVCMKNALKERGTDNECEEDDCDENCLGCDRCISCNGCDRENGTDVVITPANLLEELYDDVIVSNILNSNAPCSHLSFATNSGKSLLWFYKNVNNLNLQETKETKINVNAFVSKGEFKIIIPCDNLLMSHCLNLVNLATEANLKMCDPLENISLLEHEKPMTEEMIEFVGINDLTLTNVKR